MMRSRVLWGMIGFLVACGLAGCGRGGAGAPQVLLEVHPNERGQGPPTTSLRTGVSPSEWPVPANAGSYAWKVYQFYGSRNLRIQVCAQTYASFQNKAKNGFGNGDALLMNIDGVTPKDLWEIQSGPAGGAQWDGDKDQGKRVTLEFLVTGLEPGKHTLDFAATMCPIIYWIKVCDLEQR